MTRPAHVLVVDDEAEVRQGVVDYLRRHGIAAMGADGGAAMRAAVEAGAPIDLIVLDLVMPGEDGLSLLRWLRARSRLPVIMLTATAEPFDRTIGLELGADDYVAKPCDPRELLARVRAVLRRGGESPARTASDETLRLGGCEIDLAGGTVLTPDGVETQLAGSETALLRAFAAHPRTVLDRDRLTRLAYGRDRDPRDRGIDSRIMRIRRLIEADPARPRFLTSVRGAGYRFDPDAAS